MSFATNSIIGPNALREFAVVAESIGPNLLARILTDAADEIERQRAEVERLHNLAYLTIKIPSFLRRGSAS
jgi:hypothetical protein